MIRTTDAGSLPLGKDVDTRRYCNGAEDVVLGRDTPDASYFMAEHNRAFLSKLKILDVPCYVQSGLPCRNMRSQFLDPIVDAGDGLCRDGSSYKLDTSKGKLPELSSEYARIAEVEAIRQNAQELCEKAGIRQIHIKACITGPFELALNMGDYSSWLMNCTTPIVMNFAKNICLDEEHVKTDVITIDEPSFGSTLPEADLERILGAWNDVFSSIQCKRGIHLHYNPEGHILRQLLGLNWNIIEGHLNLAAPEIAKYKDKSIRAPIMRTDIDNMLRSREDWDSMRSGNFEQYLEPEKIMQKRLEDFVRFYGEDKVLFAGPECGLGGWENQEFALAALKRMADVVGRFNARHVA